MPSGDPIPAGGPLGGVDFAASLTQRPFGFYVHVPFCASRCGYCDFNTYTADELGGGVRREDFANVLIAEVRQARAMLGDVDLPVSTVFVGGGTPTLLASSELGRVIASIRDEFGLVDGAEVTTEANPESVTPQSLSELREAGFTRMSFGMQSASPAVLQLLERQHTAGRAAECVTEARAVGFDHINLDLIYGTPGESAKDWSDSLSAVVEAAPDHVSAYSLIVEDGTRFAARVKRGELPMPDDDVMADRYEVADEVLGRAGYGWYEVSNWALPGGECHHNLGYWRGDHWWGVGPGAHSHVAGVRWWNAKHPTAYAQALAADTSPAQAREVLNNEQRRVEDVLLRVRLREGLSVDLLTGPGQAAGEELVSEGLLDGDAWALRTAVLTDRGRLLADAVVHRLLPD